ncbi:MAG TPA: hypothetical protein VGC32_20875 [Solirubrobacterales bacterium]
MNLEAKVAVAILGVVVASLGGLLVWSAASGGGSTKSGQMVRPGAETSSEANRFLEGKIRHQEEEAKLVAAAEKRAEQKASIERTGIDGSPGGPGESAKTRKSELPSTSASSSSFAALEGEISGEIGVAYAPLGSARSQTLGPLQVGHAWSSFKVPISVTVMLEQGGSLNSSQESLVASAITASDNEAAATLFLELEAMTGGRASEAVERTLENAEGAAVEVATDPPPPGAVSSWGQTEWPLSASTSFYGALACGAYGGATDTILNDMERVISEQQWGLGQVSFPSGASVAFKAGWGPDGSESGPFLVRQAGIIRSPQGGAVVTIAAQDSSGSFEAGVSDLDRVADWVAMNVPLEGSC